MNMAKHVHVFLGINTSDLLMAKAVCERAIGHPMECTNSTFYGGDHCHANAEGARFSLRLNYFDDGSGWRWCLDDIKTPLVLGCTFINRADAVRFVERAKAFDLIVGPRAGSLR